MMDSDNEGNEVPDFFCIIVFSFFVSSVKELSLPAVFLKRN